MHAGKNTRFIGLRPNAYNGSVKGSDGEEMELHYQVVNYQQLCFKIGLRHNSSRGKLRQSGCNGTNSEAD